MARGLEFNGSLDCCLRGYGVPDEGHQNSRETKDERKYELREFVAATMDSLRTTTILATIGITP